MSLLCTVIGFPFKNYLLCPTFNSNNAQIHWLRTFRKKEFEFFRVFSTNDWWAVNGIIIDKIYGGNFKINLILCIEWLLCMCSSSLNSETVNSQFNNIQFSHSLYENNLQRFWKGDDQSSSVLCYRIVGKLWKTRFFYFMWLFVQSGTQASRYFSFNMHNYVYQEISDINLL